MDDDKNHNEARHACRPIATLLFIIVEKLYAQASTSHTSGDQAIECGPTIVLGLHGKCSAEISFIKLALSTVVRSRFFNAVVPATRQNSFDASRRLV